MKYCLKYLILVYIILTGSLHAAHPYSTGCIPETDDDLRRKGVTLYNLCPRPTTQSLSCGAAARSTAQSLEPATALSQSVDLCSTHPWMSHVKNQKQVCACSAFAVVACLEFLVPGLRFSETELFLRMITKGHGSRERIGGTAISEYGFLIQNGITPEELFIQYEHFHDAVMAREADESIHTLEKVAPSVDYKESLDYFKRICPHVPANLVPVWVEEEQYFRGLGKRTVTVPRGFWKETNFYMLPLKVNGANIIDTIKLVLQSAPAATSVTTFVKYRRGADGAKVLNAKGASIIEENYWSTESVKRRGNLITLPPMDFESSGFAHAICICGYNDTYQYEDPITKEKMPPVPTFKFKNSWGTTWGDNGYAWVSYDFLRATDKGSLNHTGLPFVILDRPGERIDPLDLDDKEMGLRILCQLLREVKNRR